MGGFTEKSDVCLNVSSQPAETAEGFVGSVAESCGSHLLHQLPGCGGREAAEDHEGKHLIFIMTNQALRSLQ